MHVPKRLRGAGYWDVFHMSRLSFIAVGFVGEPSIAIWLSELSCPVCAAVPNHQPYPRRNRLLTKVIQGHLGAANGSRIVICASRSYQAPVTRIEGTLAAAFVRRSMITH